MPHNLESALTVEIWMQFFELLNDSMMRRMVVIWGICIVLLDAPQPEPVPSVPASTSGKSILVMEMCLVLGNVSPLLSSNLDAFWSIEVLNFISTFFSVILFLHFSSIKRQLLLFLISVLNISQTRVKLQSCQLWLPSSDAARMINLFLPH